MVFQKDANYKNRVLVLLAICLIFLNIIQNILASDILVNTNDLSTQWASSANNNTLILNVDQNLNSQAGKTLTGGSNGNYHIKANGAETILGATGPNYYTSVDIISLSGNNSTLWLEGENAANPLTLKHETNAAGSAVRINGNGNTLRATNTYIADHYYDISLGPKFSSGGAIYVTGTSNTLIFDGEKTVFDHNGYRSIGYAKDGGGLYLDGTGTTEENRSYINFDAKETIFSNHGHGSGTSDEGRALYTTGVVTVNFNSAKTLFLDNNAGSGGAIAASGSSWGVRSIYNFNSDETLFKGNTARLKSAAMSAAGIVVNFNGKVTFEENNKGSTDSYVGGVMMAEGSAELFFNNDTYFLRNQEGVTGNLSSAPAVLTIHGYSTAWFSGDNTVFQENHSYLGDGLNNTLEGGAINVDDYSNVYFNGKNVLFDKNTTRGSLNAIVMNHTGGGAAIGALRGNMVFDVDSLQFIENQSINGSGGAIKVSDGNIEIHAREAIFRKNSMFVENGANPNQCDRGGGAILINKGVLTLDADTILFEENSSGANAFKGGGAIMLDGEWKRGDSILNCISNNLTFSNNYSDYVGGAISSTGSLLNFQSIQTTFINNNAGTNGGAIYAGYCDDYYGNKVSGQVVFQKANILFDGNHADGRGGAIYMDGGSVTFECEVNQGLPILPTSYYYNGATFINNADSLGANVIHFSNEPGSQLNLFLKPNGDIHFYGPVTSDGDNGNINKKGLGRAFFYGDNDYGGKVNIDEGPLTIRNDMTNPLLQMGSLGNTTTVFNIDGANAYINPAINVNNSQVARLYGSMINVSNGGRYNPGYISQQTVGAVDYGRAISLSITDPTLASKLDWDNPLASVQLISADGGIGNEWDLKATVKRGLGGFQGLSTNLDLVRGWGELHDTIRCAMDDIYFYGRATDDQKYAMYQIFERGPGQYLAARQSDFRSLAGKLHNQALSGFFMDRPVDHSQKNDIMRYSPKQQRFWEGDGGRFANVSGTRLWGNYGKRWAVKHGLTGYEYAPFDLTIGYDTFDYNGVLGFAVQYHEGYMVDRYHDYAASSNKVQGMTGAVYGSYVPGDWYVTWCGMFDGSSNEMTTRAMFTPDIAYGEFRSFGLGLMAEVGREFRFRRLHVTPYTGLDMTLWLTSSFTETGSDLNRRFGSGNAHVVEVPFGMRFSRRYTVGGRDSRLYVTPSVDLAYVHNFGDPNVDTSASFVYSASSPKWYPGNGVFTDRDMFRLRTNLTLARFNQTLAWNVGYGLDVRKGYSDNQFETTLMLAW